ncbi:MAG: LuxR C-terminal-related transcriptional regulator [Alphaproteobacteria bacterium]|nr:LuxR C-terminal-related transcriptional regulator [Alphaproteobacteria bacterium]
MEEKDLLFPEEIYLEHLSIINDVNFTPREIDVIACLLNARRTSQIASILSISPRTVTTHFRNIMLRLGCNSQEGIISFIERSHKLHILREYYSSLLIKLAFEKLLKEVSKLKKEDNSTCLFVFWKERTLKNALLSHLKSHLNDSGIKVELQEQKLDEKVENITSENKTLLLFVEEKYRQEFSKDLLIFNSVKLHDEKNYYFAFLKIIASLFPNINLDTILTSFREKYDEMQNISGNKHSRNYQDNRSLRSQKNIFFFHMIQFLKSKKWYLFFIFLFLSGINIIYLTFKNRNDQSQSYIPQGKEETHSLQSNRIAIAEPFLLSRPKFTSQIDDKFKHQGGIQTVALVGPGGAGKTTLARQYARMQKFSVAWEINAETRESLNESFEELAQALAKSEEEKKDIKRIHNIKDINERNIQITQFIKDKLKSHTSWLLIFDNVEILSDIQNHLPHDTTAWGNGKIILTSRDNNIRNNNHITNTLLVEELSSQEKLELFMKILNKPYEWTSLQKAQAQEFLNHLPSFPLDVSLAASLLKVSGMSYAMYLKCRQSDDKHLDQGQQETLKNITDYKFTRAELIELTIKKILTDVPQLETLLLFCSFLDSYEIPISILQSYVQKLKESEALVYLFKIEMDKHSLISSRYTQDNAEEKITFHRSIQEELRKHFMRSSSKEIINSRHNSILENRDLHVVADIKESLSLMADSIFPYITDFAKLDVSTLRMFIRHGESFLRFVAEEKMLQEINPSIIINFYRVLGVLFSNISQLDKAKGYCENALRMYRNNKIEDKKILGRIYTLQGYIFSNERNYKNAVNSYLLSLKSLEDYYGKDHIETLSALNNVGSAYMGIYLFEGKQKENLKMASDYLNRGLKIFEKENKDENTHKAYYFLYLLTTFNLAYTEYLLGHTQALESAKEAVIKLENLMNIDLFCFAGLYRRIAHMYLEADQEKEAAKYEEKAENIWKDNNNHDFSLLYEQKGDYYLIKSEKCDSEEKMKFLVKAKENYEKALSITSGSDSNHPLLKQLKNKINKINIK